MPPVFGRMLQRRVMTLALNGAARTRWGSGHDEVLKARGRMVLSVGVASYIAIVGACFLLYPLYKTYCQQVATGADPKFRTQSFNLKDDDPDARKNLVKVHFHSLASRGFPVDFVPCQSSMEVLVGEPALAFFKAYNKTDQTLTGVSTYSVAPPEAALYLDKIQCFCFEEQRIKPHELVDLPVFFLIDKEFLEDRQMWAVDDLILSYTFFKVKE